jgi:hypothetical protein
MTIAQMNNMTKSALCNYVPRSGSAEDTNMLPVDGKQKSSRCCFRSGLGLALDARWCCFGTHIPLALHYLPAPVLIAALVRFAFATIAAGLLRSTGSSERNLV